MTWCVTYIAYIEYGMCALCCVTVCVLGAGLAPVHLGANGTAMLLVCGACV